MLVRCEHELMDSELFSVSFQTPCMMLTRLPTKPNAILQLQASAREAHQRAPFTSSCCWPLPAANALEHSHTAKQFHAQGRCTHAETMNLQPKVCPNANRPFVVVYCLANLRLACALPATATTQFAKACSLLHSSGRLCTTRYHILLLKDT